MHKEENSSIVNPILICGGLILLISFAIRLSFGLFQIPIAEEFFWPRSEFSIAIAIQNLAWGIATPFFSAFAEKFGLDLAGRPATLTVRGRCRSKDGKVHTDSRSKLITALIYLNDDWSGDGGQLRLLRSNNIEDVIAEVPPHAGTLICFRNRENAWHGHTSYEGPRRALQLNWVVDDAAARKSERRHGLSARLKNFSLRSLFSRK